MKELASILLHSQTQGHIFHLRVKGKGSYAAHKALQKYYEGIDGLVDGLVEAYQGKNGLVFFEINQYLGKETQELLETIGLKNIELRKDIYGNDRMIACNF